MRGRRIHKCGPPVRIDPVDPSPAELRIASCKLAESTFRLDLLHVFAFRDFTDDPAIVRLSADFPRSEGKLQRIFTPSFRNPCNSTDFPIIRDSPVNPNCLNPRS